MNKIDESLTLSRSTQVYLKEFQSHSLEEKDMGHETTLKDSGIDTASSSTILNILSNDVLKKVFSMEFIVLCSSCIVSINKNNKGISIQLCF